MFDFFLLSIGFVREFYLSTWALSSLFSSGVRLEMSGPRTQQNVPVFSSCFAKPLFPSPSLA